MGPIDCPWCGEWTRPVFHSAKYICGRCRGPIVDCCDGEQAQPDSETFKDKPVPATGGAVEKAL